MSVPRNQNVGFLCYLTSHSLNLGQRGRQLAAWLCVQGRPAACGHARAVRPGHVELGHLGEQVTSYGNSGF